MTTPTGFTFWQALRYLAGFALIILGMIGDRTTIPAIGAWALLVVGGMLIGYQPFLSLIALVTGDFAHVFAKKPPTPPPAVPPKIAP